MEKSSFLSSAFCKLWSQPAPRGPPIFFPITQEHLGLFPGSGLGLGERASERPSWSACEGRYGVMCHSFCTIPAISAGPSSRGHGVGRPRSQAARQAAKHSRQLPSWHQTSAGCPCTQRRAGPAGEALFNHQGRDLPSWGGWRGQPKRMEVSLSSRLFPIHDL